MELDEFMSNVFVIGAGVSGLTSAFELSKYLSTVVIDRLPVIGGLHAGYENEYAIQLKHQCDESGVRFILGSTALRWSPERKLLVVGPAGIEWLPGQHLIYTGGNRPSTLAELGILGNRLGGVLASTVAHHLLESGVRLGEHVVILGNGNSAKQVGELLALQGCDIRVFPMDDSGSRPEYAKEWWPRWAPISVHGRGRVKEILVSKDGLKERLLCDAVILAAKMKPLRNIDGAIFEKESQSVTFVQLATDDVTLEQRSAHARQVASQFLSELRR